MAKQDIIVDWSIIPKKVTKHFGQGRYSKFETFEVKGYLADWHLNWFHCKCGCVSKQSNIGEYIYCEGCKQRIHRNNTINDSEDYFNISVAGGNIVFNLYRTTLDGNNGTLKLKFTKKPAEVSISINNVFTQADDTYAREFARRINETTCNNDTKRFFNWMTKNNYWTSDMYYDMKNRLKYEPTKIIKFVCEALDSGYADHIICMLLSNISFTTLCIRDNFKHPIDYYVPENMFPLTEKIAKGNIFKIYENHRRTYTDLMNDNKDEFALVINYYMSNLLNDIDLVVLLDHSEIFSNPNFIKFIKKYYSQVSSYISAMIMRDGFNNNMLRTDSLNVKTSCFESNINTLINLGYTAEQLEESASGAKNDTLSMLINLTSMRKKKVKA